MFLVHLHWTHQNVILQHLVDVQDVFRSLIFMPFYKPLSLGDRKLCLAKSGWNSSQAEVLLWRPTRLKGPLISVLGTSPLSPSPFSEQKASRGTQGKVSKGRHPRGGTRLSNPPLNGSHATSSSTLHRPPPWWSKWKKKTVHSILLIVTVRPGLVCWLVQVNGRAEIDKQDEK